MGKRISKKNLTTPPDKVERLSAVEGLFSRVAAILERARSNVVRTVNNEMVLAYWHIGREIVDQVQQGKGRATYGQQVLQDLSARLVQQYGKGFSVTNLRYFRLFYQVYADRTPEIRHKAGDALASGVEIDPKHHKAGDVLHDLSLAIEQADTVRGFSASLSWSHYRTLTKVDHKNERLFRVGREQRPPLPPRAHSAVLQPAGAARRAAA